jgi:glycosyltransferase involved in cell wall biosynthesis
MRVSVIVPTYKRPESLSHCLDALAAQDTQPDEILVVVRPEDYATLDVVQRHAGAAFTIPIERPGVVAAMNAGADASSGDVVALTDDDSRPYPDWISRLVTTYASDPAIGAVGGRDWVYHGDRLEDGAQPVVGMIDWFGRLTGNHHLGVGPPRDVEVLKGVNLSMRGDLLRQLRFDERLRGVGTEHHWELVLCLRLRRMGYRIVYDPAIAVEHRPQPRVEGRRSLDTPRAACDASHNETLALLEHLPGCQQVPYLFWTVAVGTGGAPGLARALRFPGRWPLFLGALTGRILGLYTYLRSRRYLAKRHWTTRERLARISRRVSR